MRSSTSSEVERNALPSDYKHLQGGMPFVFHNGQQWIVYHYYPAGEGMIVTSGHKNPYMSDSINYLGADGVLKNFCSGLLRVHHGAECEKITLQQGRKSSYMRLVVFE